MAHMVNESRIVRHCFSLLPEIWQEIGSCMDVADRVALSLSCKVLQHYLGWPPILKEDQKYSLLSRFDQDMPAHRLCGRCNIFHRRHLDANDLKNLDTCKAFPPGFRGWVQLFPLRYGQGYWERKEGRLMEEPPQLSADPLFWPVVHLVTRAHRYGPSYGLPLDALTEHWEGRRDWREPAYWNSSLDAVVDDGHLMLRTVCSRPLTEVRPSPRQKATHGWMLGLPYCGHTMDVDYRFRPSDSPLTRLVLELRDEAFDKAASPAALALSVDRSMPEIARYYHCPKCPSQWRVDVKHQEQAVVLRVTRFTDLGDGINSAESPEWLSLSGTLDMPQPLRQTSLEDRFRRGAVRRELSGPCRAQSPPSHQVLRGLWRQFVKATVQAWEHGAKRITNWL